MRLFRRGRHHRATATVRSVETTDRLDHLCRVEVFPALAPRFDSVLRTRLEIVPDAETFVRYDPADKAECVLDEARLHASGVGAGRGFSHLPASAEPVGLADSALRLAALDRLRELHRRGALTEEQLRTERRRVLARAASPE